MNTFIAILIMGVVIFAWLYFMLDYSDMIKVFKEYNLYLDDDRENRYHPDGWVRAYSSAEAIKYVKERGVPRFMSLDHDLGGEDTTMVFLKWMAENSTLNIKYTVHSANPIGKKNIESFVDSWVRAQE